MRMNIHETSTYINIIYIDQLLIYKSKTMTGEIKPRKENKTNASRFLRIQGMKKRHDYNLAIMKNLWNNEIFDYKVV